MAATGRATGPHEVEYVSELRNRLLGPLRMHFLTAAQGYDDYLRSGGSYLFACSLRRTNSSARQILLAWGHLLPEEHTPEALALLRHYDVWLTLWDRRAETLNPSMEEPFAFENLVTFPSQAQHGLMRLYERLSTQRPGRTENQSTN